jgi:hypothetical protein
MLIVDNLRVKPVQDVLIDIMLVIKEDVYLLIPFANKITILDNVQVAILAIWFSLEDVSLDSLLIEIVKHLMVELVFSVSLDFI